MPPTNAIKFSLSLCDFNMKENYATGELETAVVGYLISLFTWTDAIYAMHNVMYSVVGIISISAIPRE